MPPVCTCLDPRDGRWWDVDGVWALCSHLHAQAPCRVCMWGWGRRRSGWAVCRGQLPRYCHILVQNSKESKNSKFETGFPCCYEVIFVKIGEQNILCSTLLAWLTLSEYLVSPSGGFHLCCCPGLGNFRRGSNGVPMGTCGTRTSCLFAWIRGIAP